MKNVLLVLASIALVSTSGCAHIVPTDLLPETGRYRLQMLDPDGTLEAPAQEFIVLRDRSAAVLVYLRGPGGVPAMCLNHSEAQLCQDVLGGHHLANAYIITPRGLARLEAEVVIAEPIRVGASWDSVEAGDCRLVREVVAVGGDNVAVDVTSRCPGRKDEKKFSERWVRGIGLQELTTVDGHRTRIIKIPGP